MILWQKVTVLKPGFNEYCHPLFLELHEIGLYLMVQADNDPRDANSWARRFMLGREKRLKEGRPYVELEEPG